jgi:TPR repeat protein
VAADPQVLGRGPVFGARSVGDLQVPPFSGDFPPVNEPEGVKWLLKAAKAGHAKAQFNLGMAYAMGKGVQTNYFEAYKWLSAAGRGGANYSEACAILEKELTPEDVVKAKLLG